MSDQLWVFAYGSLMWRPGFDPVEAHRATLAGYRRCFCIYSVHHRGSAARPGLVLGLDRGGNCTGIAYRVADGQRAAVLGYLRAREQVNGVYRQTRVTVTLDDHSRRDAIGFIAERAHPSYAGRLPIDVQARLIRAAQGLSGTNLEYLVSTLDHLSALGLRERELERIMVLAGPVVTRGNGAARAGRIDGLTLALSGTRIGAPVMPPLQRRRFLYRMGG